MTRPTPRQQQQEQETPGTTGTTGASGAPPPPPPPPQSSQPAPPPPGPGGSVPPPPGGSYEVAYSKADLEEAATALGVHPWAVAGIFFAKQTERMTMTEFNEALKEWRARPPRGQGTPGPRRRPAVSSVPPVSLGQGGAMQGYFGSPGPASVYGTPGTGPRLGGGF